MSHTSIAAHIADRASDKDAAPFMDGKKEADDLSALRGISLALLLGAMAWIALLAPFIR